MSRSNFSRISLGKTGRQYKKLYVKECFRLSDPEQPDRTPQAEDGAGNHLEGAAGRQKVFRNIPENVFGQTGDQISVGSLQPADTAQTGRTVSISQNKVRKGRVGAQVERLFVTKENGLTREFSGQHGHSPLNPRRLGTGGNSRS